MWNQVWAGYGRMSMWIPIYIGMLKGHHIHGFMVKGQYQAYSLIGQAIQYTFWKNDSYFFWSSIVCYGYKCSNLAFTKFFSAP